MSEELTPADVPMAEAAVVAEVPVGQQLRLAREARGLSVAEIAQTLKLGQRQVASLEAGDWQQLPGQTFVRGFVRNYARLVQLDAGPLMAQLEAILEPPASNLDVPETRPAEIEHGGFGSSARKDRQVMLVGAGLLAVAALAYLALPNDLSALRGSVQALLDSLGRKEEPAAPAVTEPVFPPGTTPQQVMNPQVLAPAETSQAPAAKAPEGAASDTLAVQPAVPASAAVAAAAATPAQAPASAPTAAPAPSAAQMRFVADKAAWVEVRDRDNKIVFSQRMAAGSEQVLAGPGPLSIIVGYAPGVRLFWHGQAVDLAPHTKGDVARLVLE